MERLIVCFSQLCTYANITKAFRVVGASAIGANGLWDTDYSKS